MNRSWMMKHPKTHSAAAAMISHPPVRYRQQEQQYGAAERQAQRPVQNPENSKHQRVFRKGRQRRGSVRIKPGEIEALKKIRRDSTVEVMAPKSQHFFNKPFCKPKARRAS